MRVIIAPTDPRSGTLATVLHDQGIKVEPCDDLCSALEMARIYDFDLLMFDAVLPGIDCAMISNLRMVQKTIPVLILGTNVSQEQTVGYYASGADDILAWPQSGEIMAARIRAIVRRYRGADPAVWTLGPLRLDLIRRSLKLDDIPIILTSKEYDVLEAMVLSKGVTLTKDVLLDQLYGGRDAPNGRIIDVFVCKLRKKLAACGVHDLIATVRGSGYLLNEAGSRDRLVTSMVTPTRALNDAAGANAKADALLAR